MKINDEMKRQLISKWFEKGRQSVLRKNESGCCCILNDCDEIVSVCNAHREWLEKKLAERTVA